MFARPAVVAGAAAAAVLVAALALALAPEWVRTAGLDGWNLPASVAEHRQTLAEREDINNAGEGLRCRIAMSADVVTRLVGRQLTLAAAVAELDHINHDRPGFAVGLAGVFPDAPTHRHRVARYAISKAGERLRNDPTRQAEVSARLEAEYRVMLAAW